MGAIIGSHLNLKIFMKYILFIYSFFICQYICIGQSIGQYEKFETAVELSTDYNNPYDYDEISIHAEFISPSGVSTEVYGFYMDGYEVDTITGSLSPLESGFAVRFCPNELGDWNYTTYKTDSIGTTAIASSTFQCVASTNPHNKGFIRKNSSNYLNYDDGEQYIMVGENMAWQISNTVTNYKAWLSHLSNSGGNWIRLWHAHWGLGLEWKNGTSGYNGLRDYKQTNSAYLDWLYEYCADNGVYVMLALHHHGQVSNNVNPNWNNSPYNTANGGPCDNTWDFFTNEEAKNHTKNRLRYIVARWGYSKNIMAWELFNEVDWTDNFQTHKSDVASWKFEMAEYLKSIDPNNHLVTTSYAHDNEDDEVWGNDIIDISQTHYYNNIPNLERTISGGIKQYINDFNKPTLTGEFGLGASVDLSNIDPNGIQLHNSLWSSILSGAAGTAMTWWWQSYIHPENLYYHFTGIKNYSNYVPFIEKSLKHSPSIVEGATGSLSISPTLGWSNIGTDSIVISSSGQISPEDYSLSQYLYGSEWNTQFRSPPRFFVDYSIDGDFKIMTAANTGQNPRLTVWIDNIMVLDTTAEVNTVYSVDISTGPHEIIVDNTGTDWITIANYEFSELGSGLDAYILTNDDRNYIAGWALNNAYNHTVIEEDHNEIEQATITIPDFENGYYYITWFDCLTGLVIESESIEVYNNALSITINDLYWDIAFIIDAQEIAHTEEEIVDQKVRLYPNPINAGQKIYIDDYSFEYEIVIDLLDMNGRLIYSEIKEVYGLNKTDIIVPHDINSGMYWLRISENNGNVIVKPIMISTL